MNKQSLAVLVCGVVFLATTGLAQEKKEPPKKNPGVFTNAKEAGPDFQIQGEYEGTLGEQKYGAQVVARGDGKFDVYFLTGGLPGAGWDTKGRVKIESKTEGEKVVLGSKWSGTMSGGQLAGKNADGKEFQLKRIVRESKTINAKAPEGAIILFDGKNADEWAGGKLVEENLLFCGTTSKKALGAGKLHIEFRTPFQPKAGGQGRGNSGVYIQGSEVQVLDSFGLDGKNNECGGFYGHQAPAVNMCFPPLSWQTYDIEIVEKNGNTLATVLHNGVKIHEDFVIRKGAAKPTTINLQNHGNPVMYRNIWFVEAKK